MAAPSKPTGTVQHQVFVSPPSAAALAAVADRDTLAEVKAAVGVDANRLTDATQFGPIELRGNPVSFTPLGAGTTKQVAGAAALGEFSIRFVPTEVNEPDNSILAASVGFNVEAMCLKVEGMNEVAYYVRGEVSGITSGFDTPAEAELRIALSVRPTRLVA